MTTLKTIFMFWRFRNRNNLVICDFRNRNIPVPPGGYDNIKQIIRNSTIACDFDSRNVEDIAKIRALIQFANEKLAGNFNNANRISFKDFVSLLVYLRNHIIHVGEGNNGFSRLEIISIEKVITVLFQLTPIEDQTIKTRFEDTTGIVITQIMPDIVPYEKLLASAKSRLQAWTSNLETSEKIERFKRAINKEYNNWDSVEHFSGIKIKIKRITSVFYGLHPYSDVYMKIPQGLTLRVGSRGIGVVNIASLLPIGSNFGIDEDTICSLAVEGINIIIIL